MRTFQKIDVSKMDYLSVDWSEKSRVFFSIKDEFFISKLTCYWHIFKGFPCRKCDQDFVILETNKSFIIGII